MSNITFENSLGHGIIGINVLGSSVLKNIGIYHNKTNNNNTTSLSPISGIILVFMDTRDNNVKTEAGNVVLIDQCTICCMSDYPGNVQSNKSAVSKMINGTVGCYFHQQTYIINAEIVNTVMTNISSQNTSLVYFVFNSSREFSFYSQ